jgi:hypothetical protein
MLQSPRAVSSTNDCCFSPSQPSFSGTMLLRLVQMAISVRSAHFKKDAAT